MADIEGGFEVIYDGQSTTTSTGGPWQPGQRYGSRSESPCKVDVDRQCRDFSG
jgi:hypothetical protein